MSHVTPSRAALAACLLLSTRVFALSSYEPYYSFSGDPLSTPAAASHLVQDAGGSLYGMGGSGTGSDSVFKLTPQGQLSSLYTFADNTHVASLIYGADGNFYGVGYANAGAGSDVAFRITPEGSYSVLHTFSGALDGATPYSLVLAGDGNFYGTTGAGVGTGCGGGGCGGIFKLTPQGSFSSIYTFTDTESAFDHTLLVGQDGNLYGAAPYGGFDTPVNGNGPCENGNSAGCGTVWKATLAGGFSLLYSFSNGTDGSHPTAIAQGSDGTIYVTTENKGTLVSVGSGTVNVLHTFGGPEGVGPATLVAGPDGLLYGTTGNGGVTSGNACASQNCGTLFSYSPATATLTVIHAFDGGVDGGHPDALVAGNDGALYGATDPFLSSPPSTHNGLIFVLQTTAGGSGGGGGSSSPGSSGGGSFDGIGLGGLLLSTLARRRWRKRQPQA